MEGDGKGEPGLEGSWQQEDFSGAEGAVRPSVLEARLLNFDHMSHDETVSVAGSPATGWLATFSWIRESVVMRWKSAEEKVLHELELGEFDASDPVNASHRIDNSIQVFIRQNDSQKLAYLLFLCNKRKVEVSAVGSRAALDFI